MKPKYLAIAGTALLFIYEFYAIGTMVKGDTISEVVWRLSDRPLFPFAFGLLMGHFFWQSGRLKALDRLRAKWATKLRLYQDLARQSVPVEGTRDADVRVDVIGEFIADLNEL